MQPLSERDHRHTNGYSACPLHCDSVLSSPDRIKGSVPDLKTLDNNPDAALTATARAGQGLRVPVVYVLNTQENIECLTQNGGRQFLFKAEDFGGSWPHFL
jgi:hypothetical protein